MPSKLGQLVLSTLIVNSLLRLQSVLPKPRNFTRLSLIIIHPKKFPCLQPANSETPNTRIMIAKNLFQRRLIFCLTQYHKVYKVNTTLFCRKHTTLHRKPEELMNLLKTLNSFFENCKKIPRKYEEKSKYPPIV